MVNVPKVSVMVGSESDLKTQGEKAMGYLLRANMRGEVELVGVPDQQGEEKPVIVNSVHRNPAETAENVQILVRKGVDYIIVGAGWANHLSAAVWAKLEEMQAKAKVVAVAFASSDIDKTHTAYHSITDVPGHRMAFDNYVGADGFLRACQDVVEGKLNFSNKQFRAKPTSYFDVFEAMLLGCGVEMHSDAIVSTNLDQYSDLLETFSTGKVCDIYRYFDGRLILLRTDRLSAFDRIITAIPGKGAVLTALTKFWSEQLAHIVPNNFSYDQPFERLGLNEEVVRMISEQAIFVNDVLPLPAECIVRGYIIGSGWKDYQKTGKVCGHKLKKGLKLAEQLAKPLFTPSTKAEKGQHDENISFNQMVSVFKKWLEENGIKRGAKSLAEEVRHVALELYTEAAEYARKRGIIIADTKFEFGIDEDGKLHVIDEILTPDSSRFWPAEEYEVGQNPPSFDKQFVRDHLEETGWDKESAPPTLPLEVIEGTQKRYQQALECLRGNSI